MNVARRPLIAGNWKMNAGGANGCELAAEVARAVSRLEAEGLDGADVVVAPPFTALAAVAHELAQAGSSVMVAAQNMHPEASGAFTGEVSAPMLMDAGAAWVIVGHSERRQLFGESDQGVALKTGAATAAGLQPIVCVGETLEEREAGRTLEVVGRQIAAVVDALAGAIGRTVVAYEPVWAIGTGRVASPEDAQEVHGAIRASLAEHSAELATATRILYGGSVKANNAEGLLAQADIDGALVGGASLEAPGFAKIVEIAAKLAKQSESE